MKLDQLRLVPFHVHETIPNDVESSLKEGIVTIGKTASDMTLRMTYLDPDNTRSQTIGTYLRDNITSRLETAYVNNRVLLLRVVVKRQQFKLYVDSANGITYSFPLHRCGPDYVPKGAARLKRDIRSKEQQNSLIRQQPPGLFVGMTYHEEKGLIEIFLGQLFPSEYKTKYKTTILSMLYSKAIDSVDTRKIPEYETENVEKPVVKLRQK